MSDPGLFSSSTLAAAQQDKFALRWWHARHAQKLTEKQQRRDAIKLVFLGDSITQAWEQGGQVTWQNFYAKRGAFNLGFNGDRTENLLWRLQHGALEGTRPKVIVLQIGTNNIGHRKDPPEVVAAGLKALLDLLTQQHGQCKIILLAIFPRGKRPTNPLRQLVLASNQLLKTYCDNKQVYWLDLTSLFVDNEGIIAESIMPDMLHLAPAQYSRWAEAMEPMLSALLVTP